jgi:HPt (histidine-containing phosphotransfer) domain-containing protein
MCEHPPSAIDGQRLAVLAEELGDPQVVRDAVGTFLAELPGRLAGIRHAVSAGNYAEAGGLAHALGSPAVMLGATSLRTATKEFELAVKTGSDHTLQPLLGEIEGAAESTALEFTEFLESRTSV